MKISGANATFWIWKRLCEAATATGDVFADVQLLDKWLFDDTARVYAARAAMRISAARKCPLVRAAVPPNAVTVLESGRSILACLSTF